MAAPQEDLQTRVNKIVSNDASLTKFQFTGVFPQSMADAIANALPSNTNLIELDLKGCGVNTVTAKLLAKALESNHTLQKLNLESNRIEPAGILEIANSLRHNGGLKELRIVNQHSAFGNAAEVALADMFEQNVTLEKLVVTIKNGGSRVKINKAETRNKEIGRRKRMNQDWASLDPRKEAAASASAAPAEPAGEAAPADAPAEAQE